MTGLLVFSLGVLAVEGELLPGSPFLHPFPKSGSAQKQIIQLLRMQPRL